MAHSNTKSGTNLRPYKPSADDWYSDKYLAWRCALEGGTCSCDGKVLYAKMLTGPGITLAKLEAEVSTVPKETVPDGKIL